MDKLILLLENLQRESGVIHQMMHTKFGYESEEFNQIRLIDDKIDDLINWLEEKEAEEKSE